jgi:hypothetical protein
MSSKMNIETQKLNQNAGLYTLELIVLSSMNVPKMVAAGKMMTMAMNIGITLRPQKNSSIS